MRDALKEIVGTVDRVRAGSYSLPARVRLLEHLNEHLTEITDLHPLTELAEAGLTVADWLVAADLRRQLLVELIELDS